MLITKEVWVGVSSSNIQYYENLGYEIPRYYNEHHKIMLVKKGTKIKVNVNDLPNGSYVLVDVRCDGCEEILENMHWKDYKRSVREDGKYYCHKCNMRLFGAEKIRKIKLNNGISFGQWCYDNKPKNIADIIIKRWDENLNIDKDGNKLSPFDVGFRSNGFNKKGYWFKCLDHLEHESEQKNINSFVGGNGSITCNQCHMIAITHSYSIDNFVNKEDPYKYPAGSNKKVPMKCSDCGLEKLITITNYFYQGFGCPRCSDGISFSQKFLFNLFEQLLDKDFQVELSIKTFKWCNKYKYDFYLNKIDGIICECHGIQHYEESNNNWATLEETQGNDFDKEWLARSNKIINYIILDCRESTLKWVKNSIMNSKLPRLLNFKEEDINWEKCYEASFKSFVKIACDLWNKGMKSVAKIANELKLGKKAVGKYLKQGVELGWCNYDPKEEMRKQYILMGEKSSKKVICLNTGEIFNSQTEASIKYNINSCGISACCVKRLNSSGKYLEKPLFWMYHDEYLAQNKTLDWLYNNYLDTYNNEIDCNIKVICLTTGEIFNSQTEASKAYNINKSSGISNCCNYRSKSSGKLPDGTLLQWMYYDEYILKNEKEIKEIINNTQQINPVKKIICLTTGEVFENRSEVIRKYSNASHVSKCCNGEEKSAGKLEDGTKLKWMYYDKYLESNK